MASELLNLITNSDADHIVIDGTRYPLADLGEFSAVQTVALRSRAKVLSALQGKQDITEDEAHAADKALEELFTTIAPSVPAEVGAKLIPQKKAQVVNAFFQGAAAKAAAALQTTTTSPSSPGSSGSTEGAPIAG